MFKFLKRNNRIADIESQLIEIKQALKDEQKNTKELTKAVTQIYDLVAKIVAINTKL